MLTGVLSLVYPTVGALIASRLPGNPVGWIFCGLGLLYAMWRFSEAYADYALLENFALPGGNMWPGSRRWWGCAAGGTTNGTTDETTDGTTGDTTAGTHSNVIPGTIPDQKVLANTGGPAVLLPALGLLLISSVAIRNLLRR